MDSQFSEFSYGFALSYEITNALMPAMLGAPLFPSLIQEASLGYDVNFEAMGWPLFLQFKLAKYMTRSNSKFWDDFYAPHSRITIHRRGFSNQHNLLRELAQSEPEVYYAAPNFFTNDQFSRIFVNNRVLLESQFFPLSALPEITDDLQHYLTYLGGEGFRWHSESHFESHRNMSGERFLGHLGGIQPRRIDIEYFVGLRATLLGIIRQTNSATPYVLQYLAHANDDLTLEILFRDIRFLCSTFFGAEVFLFRRV